MSASCETERGVVRGHRQLHAGLVSPQKGRREVNRIQASMQNTNTYAKAGVMIAEGSRLDRPT